MPSLIDGKERKCLDCHRAPNTNSNAGVLSSRALCMECHGKEACKKSIDEWTISLRIETDPLDKYPHKFVACLDCHSDVARSPHKTALGAKCGSCHSAHGEETTHSPHLRVECQACHRKSEHVTLDPETDRIRLSHFDDKGVPIALTDHDLPENTGEKEFCRRCHNRENKVGAPASVLPSKGFICILCHSSPLAMGHPLFLVAFLVFIGGAIIMVSFWFSGSVQGEEESAHRKVALTSESIWRIVFSRRIFSLFKVVLLDVLLQRRILQESVKRWAIHSLIYISILLRLLLGLFSYFAYKIWPDSELAVALIDKNHGFTAFIYDLLGLFIVLGLIWAIVQRFIVKPAHVAREGQDNIALSIIGLLILLGFFLEAARIILTQIPPEVAVYSFIGYPLAKLISIFGLDWRVFYPYLWYGHALLGALLVAYLPFGKMKHIFSTPLTLVMNYKVK